MSIASEITALTNARDAIRAALAAKGVSATDHGFDDFAADIGNISGDNPPTGNINITDTQQVDVTNYATAQVVDANLIEENIKAGVTILGVTGTYAPTLPDAAGVGVSGGKLYYEYNAGTDTLTIVQSPPLEE